MSEPAEEPKLSDVLRDRREKLGRIRDAGIEPFPHEFSQREDIAEVRAAHQGLAAGIETDSRHRVAGRIVARRGHGKACFLDLRDGSGQVQLHAREDVLGEEAFGLLVNLERGEPVTYAGTGMLARCLQHEYDHLQGVVFGDRLATRQRKKLYKEAEKYAEEFPPGWPADD